MSAILAIVVKIAMGILSALPIERVVAIYLNKWVDKINPSNLEKATKTAKHLGELSELFSTILEDKQLTEAELISTREFMATLREEILSTWASGGTAKALEAINTGSEG